MLEPQARAARTTRHPAISEYVLLAIRQQNLARNAVNAAVLGNLK
jgi:hypothetical protein